MKRTRKIGLALGGGGARGLAHIGVMKVLERENIKPDIIVGTSMGALVGGALASGMKAEEIEERVASFLESDLYQASELKAMGDAKSGMEQSLSRQIQSYFKTKIRLAQGIFRPSILSMKDIEEFINFFIPDIQIEDAVIPFRAVATDLNSAECVVLKKGSLRRSILASSAVPGALPPVEINGRLLSDGGIICVVPVRCALEEGANVVIAIPIDRDIYSVSGFQTAADIYVRAGEIQGFYLERNDLESADIVIRPELGDTHWTDFSQSKQLISLGESAALDSLPKIRRLAKSIALWALTDKIKKAVKRLFVIQPSGNE